MGGDSKYCINVKAANVGDYTMVKQENIFRRYIQKYLGVKSHNLFSHKVQEKEKCVYVYFWRDTAQMIKQTR